MLSPLRVVRWVKMAAFPGPVSSTPVCCCASNDARMWTSSAGRHTPSDNRRRRRTEEDGSDDDLDMDPVESKLESIVNEERRRNKATKFHKIRRQMSERGAPERRLTWDAIEQIRYLKQASPQEWTLQRLAESFSSSPDVISRVLRSKFTASPERKIKQDSKVLAKVRQLSLEDGQTDHSKAGQTRLPTPNSSFPPMLSTGNKGVLTALSPEALAPAEFEARLVPSGGEHKALSRGTSQISTVLSEAKQGTLQEEVKRPEEKQEPVNPAVGTGLEREDQSDLDRVFLTDTELEELVLTQQKPPSAVEQKGREFFDSEGNFLYRI